ncbi:MAG: envelope stress response membrane protein PspC [Gammaproteobacteria bacterium]
MSSFNSRRHRGPNRLYRDPERGMIMGVCAGIADYFGWNLTLVRVVVVLTFFFWWGITLVVYVIMGFLLPKKPQGLYETAEDETFWRGVRRSPSESFHDLRHRFRDIDLRMQRMEGYVTSNRYDLDRQFRDLEDE